jgi:phosphatidylglycerol:prolipoprotein diacylglycerol transferase
MHPIFAEITLLGIERPIGTYGVCLILAIIVGSFLLLRTADRANVDLGAMIASVGMVVAGGFIGTTLLSIAVEWVRTGVLVQTVLHGGMVFFGALFGGFAGLWIGCRLFHLPFGLIADLSVPAVAIAHAIGRIGCFFGGCCYGSEWHGAVAVVFPHPLAPAAYPPLARHPVQLYEAACLLGLAISFALLPQRQIGKGNRFFAYVASYCVCRMVLETFRGDVDRGFIIDGWVTTSQLISALFLLFYFSRIAVLASRPK